MDQPRNISSLHLKEPFVVAAETMSALTHAFDWSSTPVGAMNTWPQSLRTGLNICLTSRYPIIIFWGTEFIQFYNDAYRPILGSTKHPAALGQPARACWPEVWHVIGPMLESVLTTGEATWSDNQLLLLNRNGYSEECYFTFSYSPLHLENGAVGGVFTAVIETTAQVLAERRLRTLRDLTSQIAEVRHIPTLCTLAANVLETNPNDVPFALIYLYDEARQLFRLQQLIGQTVVRDCLPTLLNATTPDATEGWPALFHTVQGATLLSDPQHLGLPHQALLLPLAQLGQTHPAGMIVLGISPRCAFDADYRGFLELVAERITAAIANVRAYEAERRRAEALAELDRAKTTFFSNISHEFRTPLTLLLGPIADLLGNEGDGLQPFHREHLKVFQRNALRLLKLVNTLLEFSRLEVGRIQAIYEPTDLAMFTADLASMFRSAVERAGLRLLVDCPPLAVPVYVDRGMWEKIVLNLLSNAFKFTAAGRIEVRLCQIADQVELQVSDTGCGISEQNQARLFERFYRVPVEFARTHEGTGIGLALVQELVRLHGGSVSVESSIGVGSTFKVALPLGYAHLPSELVRLTADPYAQPLDAVSYIEEAFSWLPATRSQPAALPIETHSESVPTTAPAAHILIADDNADMRNYLVHLLGKRYRVTAVADGNAALAALRQHTPDLLLSDVMMPGLDGFGLLREIRADPHTRLLPVVLLSARAGEEATIEGLSAGADDYLIKPFAASELLARINALLELSRLRREAEQREQQHSQRLSRLAEAAALLNTTLAPADLLQVIAEQAHSLVGGQHALAAFKWDSDWATALVATTLIDEEWRGRITSTDLIECELSARVCRENRPLRFTQAELEQHLAQHGQCKKQLHLPQGGGWLAAPLQRRNGQNMGLIQLTHKEQGEFTAEDEAILLQLAQMVSVALESAQSYAAEQQARREAEHAHDRVARLQAVSAALSRALMPAQVASIIVDQACLALNAQAGVLLQRNADGETFEVLKISSFDPEIAAQVQQHLPTVATPLLDVIETLSPIFESNVAQCMTAYPQFAAICQRGGIVALAVLPLLVNGVAIGVLGLGFTVAQSFSPEDRTFMQTIAQQCAQVLDRARLLLTAREAELYYRNIVEGSADAIIVVDSNGHYREINRAATELFGYTRHELLQMSVGSLAESDHDDFRQAQQAGYWRGERSILRKDGTPVDVESHITALRLPQETVYLMLSRDISVRKRAERQRRFIDEASLLLTSSLDYDTTLHNLARLAVPLLADSCMIHIRDVDAQVRSLALAHADPEKEALLHEIQRSYPAEPNDNSPEMQVLQSGQMVGPIELSWEMLAHIACDERHLAMLRALDPRTFLTVPIGGPGHILGVLTLMTSGASRHYSDDDLNLIKELAYRAAFAISNARLYRDAQEAMRRNDETLALLDTLLTNAPVGLAFVDRACRFVRINAALAEINQRPVEEHIGRTPNELHASPTIEALINHVLETGEALKYLELSGEVQGIPGNVQHVLASYYPVRTSDGSMLGVGIVVVDITTRKRSEDALRFLADLSRQLTSLIDYQERLDRVVHLAVPNLADCCFIHGLAADRDVHLLAMASISSEQESLLRTLPMHAPLDTSSAIGVDNVLSTGNSEFFPNPQMLPSTNLNASSQFILLRSLGATAYICLPLIARERRIGAITFAMTSSRRNYDPNDLALAQEIAYRVANALDNARLYAEAQNAVRDREELLSIASHDLKNPLSTIKGHSQLLRRRMVRTLLNPSDHLIEGLDKIDVAVNRMSNLIDELLDFARFQLDQELNLDLRLVDLVALVQQEVANYQQLSTKHTLVVQTMLQELYGHWDAVRLERMMGNLLSNAIKYSPNGGRVLITITTEHDDDIDWAIVAVQDQGIGIPAADLPFIFERFRRAGNVAGRIKGSGVGLLSARQIAHQHGGTIMVASEEGNGSTFTVRLPL